MGPACEGDIESFALMSRLVRQSGTFRAMCQNLHGSLHSSGGGTLAQGPMSASPVPVSQPPVSPAPRTSSRRKWIIIAIVVILIGSAAGGAYLLLRSQTVSLRVETTTVFATATEPVAFDARIT